MASNVCTKIPRSCGEEKDMFPVYGPTNPSIDIALSPCHSQSFGTDSTSNLASVLQCLYISSNCRRSYRYKGPLGMDKIYYVKILYEYLKQTHYRYP